MSALDPAGFCRATRNGLGLVELVYAAISTGLLIAIRLADPALIE